MDKSKMEWAYETMACFVKEEYRMLGVENAFAKGSRCAYCYREIWDAYERIRKRLVVVDEDPDIERIIWAFEEVQQELCYQMYHYGATFGEDEIVGLSMMCYTFGKEKRMCLGDFQLSGLMGKLLYCRCLAASCFSKSAKL